MLKLRMLRCSFCRKSEAEVSKLVAGPRVYICDDCVAVASQIMNSHDDSQPPKLEPTIWRKLLSLVSNQTGVKAFLRWETLKS